MPPQTFYCLDSNVYIEAGKDYYSFDLCDSFWQHLVHHSGGRVVSIDRVKAELTVHNNKLSQWVAGPCSAAFASTNRPEVIHWYGQIQQWAHSRDFTPAALNKFGTVADAWLVAFAKATGRTVVTHEGWDLKQRNDIRVPIVCQQFGVEHVRTFAMLRDLGVKIG